MSNNFFGSQTGYLDQDAHTTMGVSTILRSPSLFGRIYSPPATQRRKTPWRNCIQLLQGKKLIDFEIFTKEMSEEGYKDDGHGHVMDVYMTYTGEFN